MWSRASPLLDGAITVSLDQTAAAVRLLAERAPVVAEGAGGLALARALLERHESWNDVAVVVSGGNIDSTAFSEILRARVPAV
jgi:threonine dehydratase